MTRLPDDKIIPFNSEAILFSKDNDHQQLEEYLKTLVKVLRDVFFQISDVVNINDTPPILTKTANYTLTKDDKVILADATSGAITMSLPVAALAKNLMFDIKKVDSSSNTVTVDGDGSEEIDGAVTFDLLSEDETVRIICNGTAWFIL